jgi:hypothetical protein
MSYIILYTLEMELEKLTILFEQKMNYNHQLHTMLVNKIEELQNTNIEKESEVNELNNGIEELASKFLTISFLFFCNGFFEKKKNKHLFIFFECQQICIPNLPLTR